jgi:hypothetical protein
MGGRRSSRDIKLVVQYYKNLFAEEKRKTFSLNLISGKTVIWLPRRRMSCFVDLSL